MNEQTSGSSTNSSEEMLQKLQIQTNGNELIKLAHAHSVEIDDYDEDEEASSSPQYVQETFDELIVTSIPGEIFYDDREKEKFEMLFKEFEDECRFFYFRGLRRCTIRFQSETASIAAQYVIDGHAFLDQNLKVFFSKPIRLKNTSQFLQPPKNEKTFLISPPASPPVGWEQEYEDPPVVNYHLLAALAKLAPNEPCELIKSNKEIPGIVVHPCEDAQVDEHLPRKFIPTRRPPHQF